MRTTMCALALMLVVAGCSSSDDGSAAAHRETNSGDAPSEDLTSRLKSGDTTVCIDAQVQQTALETLVDPGTLQKFQQHGGRLIFDTVSAAGVNKDIGEVSCSANLNYNGGHSPIQYQVRPALDQSGIVVETLFPDRTNLNLYIGIVEEGRARQQVSAADKIPPKESDPQQAPSGEARSIKALERRWLALETECRGGPHQADDAVCTERDRVADELQRRGVCWAYSDWRVYPPDYRWHPCSEARPKGWHPSTEFENISE